MAAAAGSAVWRGLSQGFCHVCGNNCTSGKDAISCANERHTLANGMPACTKQICHECFDTYGWDWAAAWADSRWVCTHCNGVCPRCCMVPVGTTTAVQGALGAQLAQAQQRARYLACLQSISEQQTATAATEAGGEQQPSWIGWQ